MRDTRKALFGFGAIHLPIFGNRDGQEDKDDVPDAITAKIVRLRDLGYGKYEYVLDNNMRWQQTESSDNEPRIGQEVTIRSAAMGSYFLKVGKQHAVRAMRTQ